MEMKYRVRAANMNGEKIHGYGAMLVEYFSHSLYLDNRNDSILPSSQSNTHTKILLTFFLHIV